MAPALLAVSAAILAVPRQAMLGWALPSADKCRAWPLQAAHRALLPLCALCAATPCHAAVPAGVTGEFPDPATERGPQGHSGTACFAAASRQGNAVKARSRPRPLQG